MSEQQFQTMVKAGKIVLALSLIGNLYFVMRHFEVYREAARLDQQIQKAGPQMQIIDAALREFAAHANSDANIRQILAQHQLLNPGGGR